MRTRPNPQGGYALLVILLMVTLLLISLSAAVPSILHQGQREKEEELIFRAQQYQKAIARYYRKFGRFPMKMEDLLETNDLAFLRKEYKDPMSRDGQWRILRVGPAGEIIGSVNDRSPLDLARLRGQNQQQGDQQGQGSRTGDEPPEEREARAQEETQGTSPTGGDSSLYPIIGVASRSTAFSVRVYDGYNQYHRWEFIYDPVQEALAAGQGVPGAPQAPGQPAPASGGPGGTSNQPR